MTSLKQVVLDELANASTDISLTALVELIRSKYPNMSNARSNSISCILTRLYQSKQVTRTKLVVSGPPWKKFSYRLVKQISPINQIKVHIAANNQQGAIEGLKACELEQSELNELLQLALNQPDMNELVGTLIIAGADLTILGPIYESVPHNLSSDSVAESTKSNVPLTLLLQGELQRRRSQAVQGFKSELFTFLKQLDLETAYHEN